MRKLALICFLFFTIGCGDKIVEKTSFQDVSVFLVGNQPKVEFKKFVAGSPRSVIEDVFVNLSSVSIDIDSSLPGTALTIMPTFGDRFYPSAPYPYYNIFSKRKAVVWVRSEQEKKEWEKWLKSEDERLLKEYADKFSYKVVIPR